jgi:hypothetical protein
MRHVLALLCLVVLAACTGEFSDSETLFRVADTSGSIELPLVGSDATGRTYHLRGATFEVSGTAMVTLGSPAAARTLTTPLPMGSYQLYLRPGYRVVEVAENGSEQTVPARLSSANPAPFSLEPRADGRLRLTFQHGDVRIAFGAPQALPRAERPVPEPAPTLAVAR